MRESAPLGANACGTFGSATTITGTPTQNAGAGIVSGNCYRYTLTGIDNVGNTVSISTIVRVDATAPNFGTPALTLADDGQFAHYPGTGTTVYYNGTAGTGSSITVDAPNVADPETGVQSVTFPSPAWVLGRRCGRLQPVRHHLHLVDLERQRLADGHGGERRSAARARRASPWRGTSRLRRVERSR